MLSTGSMLSNKQHLILATGLFKEKLFTVYSDLRAVLYAMMKTSGQTLLGGYMWPLKSYSLWHEWV